MCFSILYKKLVYSNPVHKELSSKNVTGPKLCNTLSEILKIVIDN